MPRVVPQQANHSQATGAAGGTLPHAAEGAKRTPKAPKKKCIRAGPPLAQDETWAVLFFYRRPLAGRASSEGSGAGGHITDEPIDGAFENIAAVCWVDKAVALVRVDDQLRGNVEIA